MGGRWSLGVAESKIWDTQSGRVVKVLNTDDAHVAFSPDDRWLVTGSSKEYVFWQTGSWEKCHTLGRKEADQRGPLAFSPDGRWVAIASSPFAVSLVESSTGREIATLLPHRRELISCLAFSGDATTACRFLRRGRYPSVAAGRYRRSTGTMASDAFRRAVAERASPAMPPSRRPREQLKSGPADYPVAFPRQSEPIIEWHPGSHAASPPMERGDPCDERANSGGPD